MGAHQPLAARMRPNTLADVVGQGHLVFPGSPLELVTSGKSSASILLYGPPGCGKTTIAGVIAESVRGKFVQLSATSAGVADVRKVLAAAEEDSREGVHTVLFLDEIHRFTKSQQDVFLPAVESGVISLIGATTENPSFSVNAALVSRSVMLVLKPVQREDVVVLLRRALDQDAELAGRVTAAPPVLEALADLASGDVRQALGRLETVAETTLARGDSEITMEVLQQVSGNALARYDRQGDQHYDVVSAFIKSMRGSDPNGALHWLARMIDAGEDPRFIARRIVVHASEDVGMADPTVLPVAIAAAHAVQLIGMPEARINLAQAAVAVAVAPKSPAVIDGIDRALQDVRSGRTGEVPTHLRDAHYPGAKALGHGVGYLFPHDFPFGVVAQQYLPDAVLGTEYYSPTANGFEKAVGTRIDAIARQTQKEG
ncbi:replication-associated recombination protein A [Microbacterium sp. SL62]|uniref:replication-associated recombination protein A n=1 Tax=Microbacterium sp. SL62 TaxID=2995139 RepID=UPI002275E4CC|nr:replication-associated recombination protein A [Microbacterium sp. SL62]MCY1718564.1 replication-associated recombination protein A [Microbacterium sp. SL62]